MTDIRFAASGGVVMRDLSTVLRAVLDAVPPEESGLRNDIENILNSLLYAPPEASAHWWRYATVTLNSYTYEGDARPWVQTTKDIFSGKIEVHTEVANV